MDAVSCGQVRCSPLAALFFLEVTRTGRGGRVARKGQVGQRAPRGVVSVGGPRRRAPMPAHIAANSGALSDPEIPIFRP